MSRSVRLGDHWSLEDRLAPALAGTPDASFGQGGITTAAFLLQTPTGTGVTDIVAARAVAMQADGRIVVAGTAPAAAVANATDIGVARFFSDGTPDATFGPNLNGTATFGFDLGGTVFNKNMDAGHAVAIQKDGKILVAGSAANDVNGRDFVVIRLNDDGTLDTTFDTDGKAIITFDSGGSSFNDDEAYAIALQADGRIVVAGYSRFNFAAARLKTDGTLDTTFAGKGMTTINFGIGFNADKATSIAIQPNQKIVLAGYSDGDGSQLDFTTVRLNSNGALDNSFGISGKVVTAFDLGGSKYDYAYGVALQKDGKIVVAGSVEGQSSFFNKSDVGLVRYNSNGSLDVTFGTNGRKVIAFDKGNNNADVGTGVFVQPDQKIVVSATVATGSLFGGSFGAGSAFGALRFNTNGTLDDTFGTNGQTVIAFPLQGASGGGTNNPTGAYAVTRQPTDGNIVLAGTAGVTYGAARLFWTEPPPILIPPALPEPPQIVRETPIPVSALPVGASPVFVGGATDGLGQVLNNRGTTGFFPGSAFTLFPGIGANVRTTTADVNGDFVLDYIGGTGPGVPAQVGVIDGATGERIILFSPFEPSFTGGVYISAADLTNDDRAEIIVSPDRGGGPVIATFDGARLSAGGDADFAVVSRFLGIEDKSFRGGARTSVGDLDGDGVPDVIVSAGFGGGPRVAIFNGAVIGTGDTTPDRLTPDFFAFEQTLRNGVFVAAGDVDLDGRADLTFAGGPGGAPRARIFSGATLMSKVGFAHLNEVLSAQLVDLFVGNSALRGGVRVAMRDVDGDGRADLVAGSGEGEQARVRVYRAATLLTKVNPAADQTLDLFGAPFLADGVFVG